METSKIGSRVQPPGSAKEWGCVWSDDMIPIPADDVVSFAFGRVHEYESERPIFADATDPTRAITAPQALAYVQKLAIGFRSFGLSKGDCVCVHAYNGIYYPLLWLGVIAAGGIVTGSNPSYQYEELSHHFKVTQTKFVIIQDDVLEDSKRGADVIASITDNQIDARHVFVLGNGLVGLDVGYHSWTALLECGTANLNEFTFRDLQTQSTTPALYATTSGTTGLPKAAVIPHRYLVAQSSILERQDHLCQGRSQLVAIPIFHAFASQLALVLPLRLGMTTYFLPRFDERAFVSSISRLQITNTAVVPPIIPRLCQNESVRNDGALQALRHIVCAGAPMNPEVQAKLYDHLSPSAVIAQCWGATELGWVSLTPPIVRDRSGSVGRLLPHVVLKILTSDGTITTQDGTRGEALIRSASMMLGYRTAAGRQSRHESFDEEGFYHTGDQVFMEKGQVFIVGRTKDIMKVKAYQVAPEEIENVVMQLSDPRLGGKVRDVAVAGATYVNRDQLEETRPRAYVVKKTGSDVTSAEISTYVADRLAPWKKLTGGVYFVSHIPRSVTGKILRKQLHQVWEQEQEQRESSANGVQEHTRGTRQGSNVGGLDNPAPSADLADRTSTDHEGQPHDNPDHVYSPFTYVLGSMCLLILPLGLLVAVSMFSRYLTRNRR